MYLLLNILCVMRYGTALYFMKRVFSFSDKSVSAKAIEQ